MESVKGYKNYSKSLIAFISLMFIVRQSCSTQPVIKTDCGAVAGKSFKVTADNGNTKTIHEFLNIPFAMPPTGERRWKAPVNPKVGKGCWNGTLPYNNRMVACPQIAYTSGGGVIGDENCLILSVRTPLLEAKKPLPVAFWIHGGGMLYGHGRVKGYHPDNEFTASMNVVTVSINYRLNYLGFLSLEELWEDKPTGGFGNYGIMDQILALKWVQKNIRNFGGDPGRVIVFGESGGGTASYGLLLASTGLSKGLFHKVIPMSGSPNYRITHVKANEIFRPIIKTTNCVRDTKFAVAKCLRSLDTKSVLALMGSLPMTSGYSFEFPENKPVKYVPIEILDPLVVRAPLEDFVADLMSSPVQHRLDILLGFNSQEPIVPWMLPPLPKWDSWVVLRNALKSKIDSFKKGAYPGILNAYLQKSHSKTSPRLIDPFYVYTTLISDVRISCTNTLKAKLLSKYQHFKVSTYVLSQPIKVNGFQTQAGHTYDTFALFGYKLDLFSHITSSNDKLLQQNIRNVFKMFFHSARKFEKRYRNRTIEFWDNKIIKWTHSYHEEECKLLRAIGLLRYSWGNVGLYDE